MIHPLVAAGWGARAETLPGAAERLGRLLTALGSVDPHLATWHPKGRTATPLPAVDPADVAGLTALVESGLNRKDIGGDVLPHLGVRVGLWTGQPESAADLAFAAGGTTPRPNVVNLRLPEPEQVPGPHDDPLSVLAAMIDALDPESVTWVTRDSDDAVNSYQIARAGWLLWLRGEAGERALTLPEASAWAGGTLVRACDRIEDFTPQVAVDLQARLTEAGALQLS